MKVKSVFRKIVPDDESGIIHYSTKFVPGELVLFGHIISRANCDFESSRINKTYMGA